MKGISTIGLLLFICALIVGGGRCSKKTRSSDRTAPDFMLSDIAGKRFYLSGQNARAIMLNFWSVHCTPCMIEMPKIQHLADSLEKMGILFVGICNDPGESGYAESLLQKMGVSYTNLIDGQKEVTRKYSVTALPAIFIIDYRGRIRFHTVGYDESYLKKYSNVFETILHEYEKEKM